MLRASTLIHFARGHAHPAWKARAAGSSRAKATIVESVL